MKSISLLNRFQNLSQKSSYLYLTLFLKKTLIWFVDELQKINILYQPCSNNLKSSNPSHVQFKTNLLGSVGKQNLCDWLLPLVEISATGTSYKYGREFATDHKLNHLGKLAFYACCGNPGVEWNGDPWWKYPEGQVKEQGRVGMRHRLIYTFNI